MTGLKVGNIVCIKIMWTIIGHFFFLSSNYISYKSIICVTRNIKNINFNNLITFYYIFNTTSITMS